METDHNEAELLTRQFVDYRLMIDFLPCTDIQYAQVEPDSQYFTELEQILACLQLNWDNQEYMITALKNSIKHGYKMIKP